MKLNLLKIDVLHKWFCQNYHLKRYYYYGGQAKSDDADVQR